MSEISLDNVYMPTSVTCPTEAIPLSLIHSLQPQNYIRTFVKLSSPEINKLKNKLFLP